MEFISSKPKFRNDPMIERISTPLKTRYTRYQSWAKNIYALKKFGHKLYIGHGDWDANTGPCQVYAYNLKTKQWETETTLDTEAIVYFYEIDGYLYVPNMDAHSGGDANYGIFRKAPDGSWETLHTTVTAEHSRHIIKYDGALWMTLDAYTRMKVAKSTDNGATWEYITCYEADGTTEHVTTYGNTDYIFSMFVCNGALYVAHYINELRMVAYEATLSNVFKYDKTTNRFVKVVIDFGVSFNYYPPLFPANPGIFVTDASFLKYMEFNGNNFVIANCGTLYKNVKLDPTIRTWVFMSDDPGGGGLWRLNSESASTYIHPYATDCYEINTDGTVLNCNFIWDFKVYNNRLYILNDHISEVNINGPSNWTALDKRASHLIEIWSTADLTNWTKHVSLHMPTIVRSFEIDNGFAYLGLGFTSDWMPDCIGEIWKVRMENADVM